MVQCRQDIVLRVLGGQQHNGYVELRLKKAAQNISDMISSDNLYYEPHKTGGGYTLIPCRADKKFVRCDYNAPLTESRLQSIDPGAYSSYKETRELTQDQAQWAEDLAISLVRPIVNYPSPWAQDVPRWMKDQAQTEKLIDMMRANKGGEDQDKVSLTEAAIYMYPASMSFPLDSDWNDIYMYTTTQTMRNAGKQVPADIAVDELSEWRMRMLDDLRRWLYRQSIRAAKGRS